MYDLHAHILPCADHGSPNADTAREQMKLLFELSVTHAVATPHFYADADSVESFLSRRALGADALLSCKADKAPTVYLGAEVLASEGIDHMEGLDRLCISGTNILLLEMPFFKWNDSLVRTVRRLCHSSLRVMLAHVDRYPPDEVEKLFDMGAIGQINTSAFLGFCSCKRYRAWIQAGAVQALGTDLHLPADFNKRTVARAKRKIGEVLWNQLSKTSAELLLNAEILM